MEEMVEVTQAYFHKVIHPLNVHFQAHKEHGEWKLNGYSLVAKTTPGYANQYINGVIQQERYFVIPAYSPTSLALDGGDSAPSQALSTPEIGSIGEVGTTPPAAQ